MAEVTTFITPEMRAKLGVPEPPEVSPPVELTDIRKWAIAVYWPEPPPRRFWDEAHAKTTRWGGIVAPEEFNPFAWWPVGKRQAGGGGGGPVPDATGQYAAARRPGTTGVNGGGEARYYAPIRPGDVIASVNKLVELYEKTGGRTGLMLFRVSEDRWTNQRGELVKTYRGTGITY
ncbi:MAG: MaoC family dehydratase N-terminal domain-containing protein [Chloroflexi bacterium]|nr:MaoC family dehydratase N-terminal domain-containing protein [Chloroflexota bacterium]